MASEMHGEIGEESRQQPRVCDSCIRRKVKCDQRRPACSRCLVRRDVCTYTLGRRKPGPVPGSLNNRRLTRPWRHLGARRYRDVPFQHSDTSSPRARGTPTTQEYVLETPESNGETSSATLDAGQLSNDVQEENYLVTAFFDIIKDANPIFCRTRFLEAHQNGSCSRDLVLTIVTITAKLTRHLSCGVEEQLDSRMDRLLSATLLDDEAFEDSPTLDKFRKSCLLALYDFHQNPGHQSWARIGKLTRLAYRQGLDRIERLRTLYPDWAKMSKEDLDEWRAIWWCVYRLDSYSNISSGTPYLIDETVVNTSLIGEPAISLPSQPDDLWQLLPPIISNPELRTMNIHIATTTALRQVGRLRRASALRSLEENSLHITNVEQSLCRVCLALPPGWLNPRRNIFANETRIEFHARMVTILHIKMARLILAIVKCDGREEAEWLKSWEQTLETCQDITAVAEQWDSSYCLQMDPALSFVLFTALIFLTLHKKSAPGLESGLLNTINHGVAVLRLQLEQFASIWTLMRLLILAYKSFDEILATRLSYHRIALILSWFDSPLHPRWLQSLSSIVEDSEPTL